MILEMPLLQTRRGGSRTPIEQPRVQSTYKSYNSSQQSLEYCNTLCRIYIERYIEDALDR
jgi:hypothetical protein